MPTSPIKIVENEPVKLKTIVYQFSILKKFQDVFPEEITGVPPNRELDFTIDIMPGSTPISWAPYHMSIQKMIELRMQLHELLNKKYIQASVSLWGAPVLFVKNKNDTFRMCINERKINKMKIKNKYPLSRIDDLFHQVRGAKNLSKNHPRSGYHRVCIKEEDIHKIAFQSF